MKKNKLEDKLTSNFLLHNYNKNLHLFIKKIKKYKYIIIINKLIIINTNIV